MFNFMGMLLLLAPLPGASVTVGEWKTFTSKEGNYEVQLPGEPRENRNSVKTSVGTGIVVLAVLEVKQGEGNYVVGFSELPEAVIKSDTEEKRLDNARDGAVSSVKGKLKSEKQIKLDTHNGRELEIEVSPGMVV